VAAHSDRPLRQNPVQSALLSPSRTFPDKPFAAMASRPWPAVLAADGCSL